MPEKCDFSKMFLNAEIKPIPNLHAELKPCPFCGSTKLKIMSKSAKSGHTGADEPVDNMTFSVRCNVCHARGGAIGGKVIRSKRYFSHGGDLPQWATTAHILRKKAIALWNTRTRKEG